MIANMIPQVQMIPSPIKSTPLTFDRKLELVEKCLSYPDGWKALTQSIKQSGNPSARLQCLSLFKKIASDKATEQNSEQQIFNELVKTLDEYLKVV